MISQKTRAALSVSIGTIIITFGTLLLVALASGYSFDLLQGKIFATALVLLDTNPSGATIKTNDRTLSQKTPYRLEGVETGTLMVRYTHPDYRDWQTSFFVQAGEVSFANYALLIPNTIEPKRIPSEQAFSELLSSTERARRALISASPVALWGLSGNGQITRLFTPSSKNGHVPTKLSSCQFSPDASQVLCTVAYNDGSSDVMLTAFPSGQTVNVSEAFRVPLGQLQFNPQNARELYNLNAGVLSRLNTDTRIATPLALAGITGYILEQDKLYTLESNPDPSATQILVSYDLAGNGRYVLSELPKFAGGQLVASRLHGINYITVRNPVTGSLQIVRRETDRVVTSELGSNVRLQAFSTTGRFYSYVQGEYFKTIDLEFYDRYGAKLPDSNLTALSWLTDFQLVYKTPSSMHILDFTGQNNYAVPPELKTPSEFSFGASRQDKQIDYLVAGELFSYSLQPKGGLINFR